MKMSLFCQILAASLAISTAACVGVPLSAAEMAGRRMNALTARWSGLKDIPIRYNPARCDCPEFEIKLDLTWYRVVIENDVKEDALAASLYSMALRDGPGWSATIAGEIDGVLKKRYRSPVIRLRISRLCTNEGCVPGLDAPPAPALPATPDGSDDTGRAGDPHDNTK